MIGKTISHYKILEKLGEGGMGVVYKAQDMKLDRLVALKFLPKGLEADDAERARFIQEAKAASALNHPNVCVIHDLHEHEDEQFIVMEYVDGVTMREKIRAEEKSVGAKTEGKHGDLPLPLKDVLSYAIQIGEALQEAHSRGIIHRDIKSDNIMVTAKGQVKVMDFGLAKLKGALRLTKSTSTIGTLGYMAPEQLQGKETDARMDIFSFGVVLYEMLTGHMPFRGEYESALMYSILNTEPEPVTKYRPELSSEFLHVLNRALEKDPDDRYQSVNDMLIDLRRLKRDTSRVVKRPLGEILPPEPQTPPEQVSGVQAPGSVLTEPSKKFVGAATFRPVGPLRYVLPALVIIILAVAGYFLLLREGETPVPQFTNLAPVTTAVGGERPPTWSPDGIRLAYDYEGDIWVTQVPAGTPLNLTVDHEGLDYAPSWSPDGRLIAFGSYRNGPGYYIMSSIGGSPRKVPTSLPPIGYPNATLAWSPDGTDLACPVQDTIVVSVEIVSLEDFSSRKIPLPGEGATFRCHINWSPDGRFLAYVVTNAPHVSNSRIWIISIADGEGFPVTEGKSRDINPFWSRDGQFLYFISDREGGMDLWRLRIGKDGTTVDVPQRVTTGLEMECAAFSPDETKLAYTKVRQIGTIWRIPIIPNRPATLKDARQLTFEQWYIWTADISPDGTRLIFDSKRDGSWQFWMMPVEGGSMERVTSDPMVKHWPRWSPDGKEIAFHASKGGRNGIWIMPVGGGPLRQVTKDLAGGGSPAWSPDGRKISFTLSRSGNNDIWIIPASGGEARQVTDDSGSRVTGQVSAWSPDGKWLLLRSNRTGERRFWRVPVEGGNPELVSSRFGWAGTWSSDGKKVYFISLEEKRGGYSWNICEVPAEGGVERIVADLGSKGLGFEPLVTDGKSLFTVSHESLSELWMMDVAE